MLFSVFISVAPVKVNAATNENETLQVQNIVDNATFITFRKGENSSYGRFIFCCYYFPNEVYDSTMEYGVVIFPKCQDHKKMRGKPLIFSSLFKIGNAGVQVSQAVGFALKGSNNNLHTNSPFFHYNMHLFGWQGKKTLENGKKENKYFSNCQISIFALTFAVAYAILMT